MAAMNDPIAAPVRTVDKLRYVPGSGERHRHVLVVLVNNRPGVLNRVASLVRAATSTSSRWPWATPSGPTSAA